ncbi:MAG: hypothetical protein KDK30_09980, partial [Leptospiraceae bacterium]|nr:hypothetical protein [Leptospiraceae bacterium]
LDSFNRVAYSIERFFYPSGHPQAGKALPGSAVGSWYTSNGNDQTGGNLAGLGQLNSTFRTCNASGQQCTIGTPNYSGNASSKVNPSTATGGENALTNIPVAAWSTGTNSATVQMRWAMQAAPTVAGGSCACTASLNPSDPSQLLVSTQAQTSGTTYTFNVGTATDITGGTSTAGSISYTGRGQSRAQVQIYRVYPQQSSSEDIVVLRALTSGSLYNLGIYFYDFSGPNPILFHRMRDVSVTAGQFIQLTVDKSCSVPCGVASVTSEDVRVGSSPSFSITANPNSATAGNIDSTGLASNATWEVFSSVPGMSSTDGIIFISYSLSESPMDLMCYSNRDGDVSFGLMLGGFRSLNAFGSSVYPFIYPVDNANDSAVQGRCSLWPSSGSGDYLQRVQDTNSAGDFVWVDG